MGKDLMSARVQTKQYLNVGGATPARTSTLRHQAVINRPSGSRTKQIWQFFPPFLLFAVLIAQLWVRVTIIERSYELEEKRSEVLELDRTLRQINFDYDFISQPAHLVKRAKSELGMNSVSPQQIRYVRVEK